MKPPANLMLAAALRYAEMGLYVFPCWGVTADGLCECGRSEACNKPDGSGKSNRGKHPYGRFAPKGFKNATTDAETIRSCWTAYPKANIAIATGPSKLVVIDVDPKNGGDETWKQLKKELGAEIEKTKRVKTGSPGGKHFYYRAPEGVTLKNSAGKLGKGIDVRGEDGYVIAPPSRNAFGSYEDKGPKRIRELTTALLERFTGSRKPSELPQSSDTPTPDAFNLLEALGGVEEGRRNDTIFRAASSLRGTNVQQDVALKICQDAAAKCDPPYPAAEVDEIVERVYQTYQPNAGAAQQTAGGAAIAGPEFKLTPIGDLLAEPEEKYRWLVENRLPWGGISMLVAKPKVGKSTTARNLAIAVARGGFFIGSKCQRGKVLYFALEEKRNEVRIQFQQMGVTKDEAIFVHTGPAPISDLIGKVRKLINEYGANLVIFDPAVHLVRIENWNDFGPVSAALAPFINLSRETNCHIMLLHHMGKTERDGIDQVLGSIALTAAVDTIMVMRRTANQSRTIETIQRVGTDLEKMTLAFDAETQSLGVRGLTRDVEKEAVLNAVAGFLTTRTGWVSTIEILNAIEKTRALVLRALKAGVDAGTFERDGTGRKNSGYSYRLVVGEKAALVANLNGTAPKPPASEARPRPKF